MSTRKTTWFYGALIAMASLAIGMVIASRLDMTPSSAAQALATTAPPPMNSAPITGPLDAQTFRNIAQGQSPIVVSIRTTATRRTQEMTDFFGGDEFFRRFFGQPDGRGGQGGQGGRRGQGGGQPEESFGAGTGFIIDKAGLIVTNNHVVENATKISVEMLGDDEQYDAKVVGRDPLSDSALIELVKKPVRALPEAKFGDSDQMQPGDWVMAIGNPFGLDHTVSVGVISALSRQFPVANQRNIYMLQTDAAINPGNSGGPLLNLRGEVIGINTAILTGTGQNLGIGFAVPINIVRELLPQLRTGKVTRGMIGVSILQGPISQATAEERGLKNRNGAIVASVSAGSPAEKAGLRPGDVVTEFNGKPVASDRVLVEMVVGTRPGTSVPLKVIREGETKTVNVTVGELNLEAESATNEETVQGDLSKDFGLTLDDVTPAIARRLKLPAGVSGAIVSEVRPRSPAARAAITEGDVIIHIGRTDVAGATEAVRMLQKVQPGQAVGIIYIRDGQQLFTTMRRE
jgi:serine protease Do